MYIVLSWEPMGNTTDAAVDQDISTALFDFAFSDPYVPINNHVLARVGPGGAQSIVNLDKRLAQLSPNRFRYTLVKGPTGSFFWYSGDLDAAHCDRIAQ